MTPTIAVITPENVHNVSPLLPARLAGAATDWEWYDRCLSAVADVRYFTLNAWEETAGFDTVLIHEGVQAVSSGWTCRLLARLRARNGQLIWVEPHQRSTFAASVFEPEFFDAVDLVVKYQLMDYGALVAGLRSPHNNLASWTFHGHTSIERFYGDRALFALPSSPQTIDRHLECDLSPRYGESIIPMMRLFTLPRADSWYGQEPSRQVNILKESQVGLTIREGPSAFARGVLAGLLGQAGLDVKVHRSSVRAAATSEAVLAIGPVHLDGAAADVLRFETLAILPEDPRYLMWDEVFRPYDSYLPMTGFHELLRDGGRVLDGMAAQRLGAQLARDLADRELRARILAGQRAAYELLTDPHFVAAKLGIQTTPRVSSPPPATATPRVQAGLAAPVPVRVGSISSTEISVVIQGTLGRDDLVEQVIQSVRTHLPGAEVIVSTWENQRELGVAVERRIESADPGAPWQVHEEWPSNTNRLLVSTRAGLAACTRPYALKLRTDTPLTGSGFLDVFQAFPERSDRLRLLRDRVVVINYYCWNPERRPFGLFSIADTIHFGWSDDLREVWSRPLDEEPATATWFENHARPVPDQAPWAAFRYTPEQLLWLGFLRRHIRVPFAHFSDNTPAMRLLAEASTANNVVIVEADAFGVQLPKFSGREPLEKDALYSHEMWDELYDRYCLTAPNPIIDDLLQEIQAGAAPRPRLDELANVAFSHLVHPLNGGRDIVVLADAEELLASEGMLGAYAEAMRGSSLASLAIDASRLPTETAEEQLRELVQGCGLADRDDVDLLAVVGHQNFLQRRRMLRRTHAIYSRWAPPDIDTPYFSPARAAELRDFVEEIGRG